MSKGSTNVETIPCKSNLGDVKTTHIWNNILPVLLWYSTFLLQIPFQSFLAVDFRSLLAISRDTGHSAIKNKLQRLSKSAHEVSFCKVITKFKVSC